MSEECCKRSFFQSIGDTAKRMAEDSSIAPQQVQDARLNKCRSCEHFSDKGTCNLCGCIMSLKVKFNNMTCPDDPPKWKEN